MKRIIVFSAIWLMIAAAICAQSPPGGYGPSGGSSSPSSLSTYFTRYYGKAPQDYGAFGDWHIYQASINGTATLTCSTCAFTPADTGKTYEVITSANNATPVTTVTGTLTYASPTTVTLSNAPGTTVAATRFGYGHNDNTAMQNWMTAICAASVGGVPNLVHGGYLPQGGYYVTAPLVCTNTQSSGTVNNGSGSSSTNGECGPGGGTSGLNNRCSVWITGDGFTSSFIEFATAGTFVWPTTSGTAQSGNACAFNLQNWDSFTINAIGFIFDGSPHNTSSVSGKAGALCFQNSSHANVYENWVQDFHNTTNNAIGILSYNDFESKYEHNASEGNDFNLVISGDTNGIIEKITLSDDFLENPGFYATVTNIGQNLAVGDPVDGRALTFKQFRARDIHFLGSQLVDVNITGVSTTTNDALRFSDCRSTNGGASSLGFLMQGTATAVAEMHGCDLLSGSAIDAIDVTDTSAVLKVFGGTLNATTNAVNNAGAVILTQVNLQNNTIAGAGATSINAVATAFASLPTTAANGSVIGCTNCTTASNPCTGASTGAIAIRQNGAWVCK